MFRKISVLIVILLATTFCGRAIAQSQGLEVRLTSQKLIEVEPGRIVTASYVIYNGTGRKIELSECLQLPVVPEKWRSVIAEESNIVVEEGEQKVRLITFFVPKDCPPDKYDIIYLLTEREQLELKTTEEFSIVVMPVLKFDAFIDEKPEMVTAGDEYRVVLRLANRGNGKTTMEISASGSPDLPVTMDYPGFILEPGSSRQVNILVKTDEETKNKTNHVLKITSTATTPGRDAVSADNTLFVEIWPRCDEKVDPYHKVPTKIRLISTGDNDGSGFQMEYSGAGSLDEAGDHKVVFLFRGPDVQDKSIYGTRDILRFKYGGQFLDVQAGDDVYSISPLTERLIFGRGGMLSGHNDRFEFGTLYLETRWDVSPKKETGAYASCSFSDKLRIKGNYLNKRRDSIGSVVSYNADIYSIQMSSKSNPKLNIELEYGYSINGENSKPDDSAHRLALDGRFNNKIYYVLENTYAGPGFLGYYNDVLYNSGSLVFSIYGNLKSNISYRKYESNLDLDPEKPIATREESYKGVLSYSTAGGTNLSVDYEAFFRKDRQIPSQFDFDEHIWRVGIGQAFGNLSLQTYSERANFVDDLAGGGDKTLERYSLYAYFHRSNRISCSIFGRIGHSSFTGQPVWTKCVGLSTSLLLMSRLRLELQYQSNTYRTTRMVPQDHLISSLEYELPNHHTLLLRTRLFRLRDYDREDLSFFAAYTIPLGVPVARKKSFGVLKGKVFDMEEYGYPLKNVVLSVDGANAVTNSEGEFMFASLKPGAHNLQVDPRSIGLERIPSEPMPMLVQIDGGKTAVKEIGVFTASEIRGRVVQYRYRLSKTGDRQQTAGANELYIVGSEHATSGSIGDSEAIELGGLNGVMIEISNGRETLRQRSGKNGTFAFERVKPGAWRMKIHKQGLPPHHCLEKEIFQIDLANREEKEVIIKVLPEIRPVTVIDRGEIN